MKIAFVVQRYGTEILGGSEYHCRLIAERVAERHQVEVLTTCAREYITWKNEYPEGADRVRGVTVRRFPTTRTRDLAAFNQYSDWIFNNSHTRQDELEWLKQQGPWTPALVEYLRRTHQQYDVLIFFTYLYATTVLGVEVNPARSISQALFVGDWAVSQLWLFIVAPIIGAAIAAVVYKAIRPSDVLISTTEAERALASETSERRR